jgi:ADP-heptose:LPS heptosyltransferase
MRECYLHCYTPCDQEKPDTPRFLVTLDVGIGDAVAVGLSAVDQIVEDDPLAAGAIDVLCNGFQAQIFEYDPRINRIIETSKVFFPGTHITQWLRGITLDPEAAHVVHFLRERRYEAIFPSIVAPGLYFRLHSHIMYPRLFEMARNFLTFRRQVDIHLSTIVRHMVNHYFRKTTSTVSRDKDILLYIPSEHVQKAMKTVATLKEEVSIAEEDCKVLVIAPDTASAVTRPPIDLLMAALSKVLVACPNLIVYILPSYTETTRSLHLLKVLSKNYPHRVFLMPAEPRAHLLETTALIDQADIFVTGDTGVMHLAAAHKKLKEGDDTRFAPKNSVKIIALFGGTSPSYYGYSRRTTIVGWGRKEQTALRPGFSKESYNLRGRNLFDHISSQQIADAILTQ